MSFSNLENGMMKYVIHDTMGYLESKRLKKNDEYYFLLLKNVILFRPNSPGTYQDLNG